MKKYLAIDLFSGCGGLTQGLRGAGFSVAVAVEIDKLAAKTYSKNHPETKVLEKDIQKITASQLLKLLKIKRGELELLAGCPPCQGFSRIKRLNKSRMNDPRNDLVLDFLRLAKGLLPKTILLENVPALMGDRRFKSLTNYLKKKKYIVTWSVLNAENYGVPQRRKRLIMMASRVGKVELPKAAPANVFVAQAIKKLAAPQKSKDKLHLMYLKNTPKIAALIKKIPKNGGSRLSLGKNQQLSCHKKFSGFFDVYGRMSWNKVSPTLTGGCFNPSKGRYLHPTNNRAISMREAALLQTFPKTYFFPTTAGLTAVARMIGDAVPPKFAKKQAEMLMELLLNPAAQR